tara:strand:- start:1204 stop:1722 length:519 start_codon:yes stop_codon:yes gene_type:complete
MLDQMPKDAPPNFQQGWIDGCKSGLGAMTNSFYKAFYEFTQDPVLRKDPVYYKTWKDTFTFCRHYAYGTLRQGNVRMRLPMAKNIFMSEAFGSQGILETGVLQNAGPGTQGLLIENWGHTGGNPFYLGMGWEMDFSGDYFLGTNSNENPVWTWDYRPNHSIAPYHTDAPAWK